MAGMIFWSRRTEPSWTESIQRERNRSRKASGGAEISPDRYLPEYFTWRAGRGRRQPQTTTSLAPGPSFQFQIAFASRRHRRHHRGRARLTGYMAARPTTPRANKPPTPRAGHKKKHYDSDDAPDPDASPISPITITHSFSRKKSGFGTEVVHDGRFVGEDVVILKSEGGMAGARGEAMCVCTAWIPQTLA